MELQHERKASPRARPDFDPRLEAVRGLAAFAVAVGHSVLAFQTRHLDVGAKLCVLIFSGRVAVSLFFVLSGLVLGLAWQREKANSARSYARFSVRRFFRIYPAFLTSILLVCAMYHAIRSGTNGHSLGFWFQQYYSEPLSGRALAENLALWDFPLNAVTWTLAVEMVGSLLLPLMLLLVDKISYPLGKALAVGVFSAGASINPGYPSAINYLFMFLVGALVPRWNFIHRLKSNELALFSSAGIGLMFCGQLLSHISLSLPILCQGVGAAMLLACLWHLPNSSKFAFLLQPAFRFLGRVSYSFYLLHFPIMCLLLSHWRYFSGGRLLNSLLLGVSSIAVTLPLAALSFRWIEQPGVKLGKLRFNN